MTLKLPFLHTMQSLWLIQDVYQNNFLKRGETRKKNMVLSFSDSIHLYRQSALIMSNIIMTYTSWHRESAVMTCKHWILVQNHNDTCQLIMNTAANWCCFSSFFHSLSSSQQTTWTKKNCSTCLVLVCTNTMVKGILLRTFLSPLTEQLPTCWLMPSQTWRSHQARTKFIKSQALPKGLTQHTLSYASRLGINAVEQTRKIEMRKV